MRQIQKDCHSFHDMSSSLRTFTIVLSQQSPHAKQARRYVAATLRGDHAFAVGNPSQSSRAVLSPWSAVLSLRVPDDYKHLPWKVVRAFEWAYSERIFDVLVKIDDDTLFCPEQLPRDLPSSSLTYAGYFPPKIRKPHLAGRWKDLEYIQTFGRTTYPKYAQGGGYVLTRALLGRVMREVNRSLSEDALASLRIEDATIGTLVSRVEGAVHYHSLPVTLSARGPPTITAPICSARSKIFSHKVRWIDASDLNADARVLETSL